MNLMKRWLAAAGLLAAAWMCRAEMELYIVNPTRALPVLPFTPVGGEFAGDAMAMAIAPGEIHAASFVVNAPDGRRDFLVAPRDLRGPDGAVIPAAAIDVRVVKCWYQGGTAWINIQPDNSRRILVPELLLHDDRLVEVDHQTQKNYLRLSKPGGDEYIDISDDSVPREMSSGDWPVADYPVHDAPALLPLELPPGENRQFVVTCRAPEKLPPGVYSGRLDFTAAGVPAGSAGLTVEVLPFTLAEPRTNYDADREFTVSLYYNGLVSPPERENARDGNLHAYRRSRGQLEAEFRNMAEHGVTNPATVQSTMYEDFFDERNRALWHELLAMRAAAGMKNHAIFVCSNPYLNLGFDPAYTASTPEGIARFVDRAKAVMDWIRSAAGEDTEVYFYGLDEAHGERLTSQLPAWRALHAAGGKTWVSGYKDWILGPGNFAAVGEELDVLNDCYVSDPGEAAKWHSIGKRVFSYCNPQAGVENPDINRRNYGLNLYFDNYDGVCNFMYNSLFGDPWNDFDHWRDHCYTYPTQDGVIDTIAWEGFREGIDDIRYATTLRLAIREALASGDAKRAAVARAAEAWLDGLSVDDYTVQDDHFDNLPWREHTPDLEEVRLKIIEWILRLHRQP